MAAFSSTIQDELMKGVNFLGFYVITFTQWYIWGVQSVVLISFS